MSTRGSQDNRGGRGRGRGRGDFVPYRPRGDSGGGGGSGGGYRGGRGGPRGGFGGGGGGGAVEIVGGAPAPDPNVTKIEDALQAAKKPGKLDASSTLPYRPGYGTKGASVTLWANYVVLKAAEELVLRRYDVSVTPDVKGRKLSQVVRLLLDTPELAPVKGDIVTDFKSTVIARVALPADPLTIPVVYRGELEDAPDTPTTADDGSGSGAGGRRPTVYQVQLRFTNVLPVDALLSFLTSTNLGESYDNQLPMVQAFNVFLNHHVKSSNNLVAVGSSKTFSLNRPASTWDLGSGLTALRGFFASVRMATARILVNVNVSHGAFYQAGPLVTLMELRGAGRGSPSILYKLEKFLSKVRVRTTHLKEKKNKNGEVIPRIKTMIGLARNDDGRDLAHPPRVKQFAAGPKDVQFWLDGPAPTSSEPKVAQADTGAGKGGKGGKGKKGGKGGKAAAPQGPAQPAAAGGSGKYISVYDFFAQSE